MSRLKSSMILLMMLLMTGFGLPASAQFITLARKIKSKLTDGKEVATVVLDAGAAKVYKAVNDTLTSAQRFVVTEKDDQQKRIRFTRDQNQLTIRVDSLDAGYCNITVEAETTNNASPKPTDAAVTAILAVCHKVGLKCTRKDIDSTTP